MDPARRGNRRRVPGVASARRRIVLASFLTLGVAACDAGVPMVDVEMMTVRELTDRVRAARGSVVFLHLYAAWCPPCLQEFPAVNELGRRYRDRGLAMMVVSLDHSSSQLDRFLLGQDRHFAPMRVRRWRHGELTESVRRLGARYRDAIPYTAVFNRAGRLAREWTGSQDFETFRRVVEPLL